jgi:hypothetical protein
VNTTNTSVVTVSVTPPFGGKLLANAAATTANATGVTKLSCSLDDGSKPISATFVQSVPVGGAAAVSPVGGEGVLVDQTRAISLLCHVDSATATVQANLDVIAAPAG